MSLGTLKGEEERYSGILKFTRYPCSAPEFISVGAFGAENARRQCLEAAHKKGWTAPKWWQWWRRQDSKEPVVHDSL